LSLSTPSYKLSTYTYGVVQNECRPPTLIYLYVLFVYIYTSIYTRFTAENLFGMCWPSVLCLRLLDYVYVLRVEMCNSCHRNFMVDSLRKKITVKFLTSLVTRKLFVNRSRRYSSSGFGKKLLGHISWRNWRISKTIRSRTIFSVINAKYYTNMLFVIIIWVAR